MEIISKSSMGELVISDEVLSSIAVNAAKDVDVYHHSVINPLMLLIQLSRAVLKL